MRTISIILLVLAAAFSRFIPHAPNFTAIGSLGILAGTSLSNRYVSLVLVFAAMWVSDLVLNNTLYASYYSGFVFFSEGALFNYLGAASFAVAAWYFKHAPRWKSVMLSSLIGSLFFFLISNFGVWVGSSLYPSNATGLGACYLAALPFLGNMLASTLLYSALLLGISHVIEKKLSLQHATR